MNKVIALLQRQLREQREYMEENGGNQLGYLMHYKDLPVLRAVAIYEADLARLNHIVTQLKNAGGEV